MVNSHQPSWLQRWFAAAPLSLISPRATAWMVALAGMAVVLVGWAESATGVIRPVDRWLYPAMVLACSAATPALVLRWMPPAFGLRLLSAMAALYLGTAASLDLVTGRMPTFYDVATLIPWLMLSQLLLFATYSSRQAVMGSVALCMALLPLLLQHELWTQAAAPSRALVLNGLIVQVFLTAVLYTLSRQLLRLALEGRQPADHGKPMTVQELLATRRQERQRLKTLAQRADASAREQERELAAMVKAFPGVVFRVDAQGDITHVNDRLAAMYKLTPDQMIGQPAARVLPASRWAEICERQRQMTTDGLPVVYERAFTDPSGTQSHWLATQFAVPDAQGRPTQAFYQVGIDITALREADTELQRRQAQLDALFEALPLPTVVKGVDGRLQRVNRAYAEMSGLSMEQLIGQPLSAVSDPQNHAGHAETDVAALTSREPQSVAIVRRDHTGEDREMVLHKAAIFMPGGEHIGMVSTLYDMTAINRAARMMRDAQQAAEGANAAKSAFLAMISHEIRTPLNGVLGMAELLMHGELSPAQAQRAEVLRDSAISLLGLLDSVLDFSKMEAGRLSLAPESVDPRALLQTCVALLQSGAQSKGVTLVSRVDATLPARLSIDPLRWRQVVINLVSNAIKFSGPAATGRAGVVDIHWGVQGPLWCLEVADNGIGLDESAQRTVFEPFVQADVSTARRFGGTGLGLSIARGLVQLMGGEIAVSSRLNEGSRFIVTAPMMAPQALADVSGDAQGSGAEPAIVTQGAPLHVLVAEDDAVNRLVLGQQLRLLGHTVTMAEDGEQALAMVRAGHFDMLLTDLHMPRADGCTLARAVRAHEAQQGEGRRRMPILALSAHALKEEAARAMAAGIQEYLVKPLPIPQLQAALERWRPR